MCLRAVQGRRKGWGLVVVKRGKARVGGGRQSPKPQACVGETREVQEYRRVWEKGEVTGGAGHIRGGIAGGLSS